MHFILSGPLGSMSACLLLFEYTILLNPALGSMRNVADRLNKTTSGIAFAANGHYRVYLDNTKVLMVLLLLR